MFAARISDLFADISGLLSKYGLVYLKGIGSTLLLAIVATLIGCIIGFVCGILQTIPYTKRDTFIKRFLLKLIRILVRVSVAVFRGTPMILQAVFIYYGLPFFSNGTVQFTNIWVVAILVVSINTGAYMAESVRGGILAVDVGQTEAAMAIGMTHFQTMTSVIIPQALRSILPQIGNNLIINIKDTSVMFIIGFTEFFAVHKMVVGATFKYFPSAMVEMAGYLCMTLVASVLLRKIEKKLEGSSSYELVNEDQLVMTAGTYTHTAKGTPFDETNREFGEGGKGH